MFVMDLGGSDWVVSGGTKTATIPATVPGCIHTDLLAAKQISDPFYREQENEQLWVGKEDWTYRRTFTIPVGMREYDRVLLRCEGLDTLAALQVNGKPLADTDNMFRTYEFDVKPFLKDGDNTLEIRFASPQRHCAKRQKKSPHPYWNANPAGNISWIRKEPCNFGWDWGPSCVTSGIWRPIHLVAFNTARLDTVHIQQTHSKTGTITLDIDMQAETVRRDALTAAVTISFQGKPVAEVEVPLSRGKGNASIAIKTPHLWWPNRLGEQPLYDISIDLLGENGQLLDTHAKRIGLRTLRLVRKKDKWGESFYFEANGVPFFSKGANWIPGDPFKDRMTAETYEYLLRSAAESNMNMIRVWGGGIYEEDLFYELCDELGLCVWQDFMFACAAYPAEEKAFLENVRAEAEQNVRRLRHHPCLALWCGNNELEQGLVGPTKTDRTMAWKDYKALFDKLLPAVVRKEDPERDYWPCSPHSPHGDRAYHANPACGDAHLWDVWHGGQPFEWYRGAFHRFCSEFGFQSFPEPKTVHTFTLPEDRNVTSPVMEHHQRNHIGNTRIVRQMLEWYRLPTGFENTVWLSQIQQGLSMKYAVEHWRRNMPRCMGALYWQLNDCWPVASWASIDYHGRWKALQYMARHFYAPVLVSGVEDTKTSTVAVHLSSDRRETVNGTLAWRVTTVNGTVLDSGTKRAAIGAGRCKKIETLRLKKIVEKETARNILVWLEYRKGKTVLSRNLVTFARPKQLSLRDPAIKATAVRRADGSFRVTLSAKRPALWAWMALRDSDAQCSDNFVCLAPGDPIEIDVIPVETLSKKEFVRQLQIHSLFDTYQ